ncbi:hypothetical protein BXT84_10460 [Sulfobacillus thermotolerans]|uniref:Phosphocarrier protein HPr n=1 Tax=Sulfobacillus thermotolerans TaxID=338644 RepID=A0ABN5H135_9FIRM|nr:hypothetical protein BXT84_10460 [Sulfobacillus thermotolerans]
MITRSYVIADPQGLHARPAAQFIQAMALCPEAVQVTFGEKHANGKSILNVLALGVRAGDAIVVHYQTDDEAIVKRCEEALKPLLS